MRQRNSVGALAISLILGGAMARPQDIYAYRTDHVGKPDLKFYKLCISIQRENPAVKLVMEDSCGPGFRSSMEIGRTNNPDFMENTDGIDHTFRIWKPNANFNRPKHPAYDLIIKQRTKDEYDKTKPTRDRLAWVGLPDEEEDGTHDVLHEAKELVIQGDNFVKTLAVYKQNDGLDTAAQAAKEFEKKVAEEGVQPPPEQFKKKYPEVPMQWRGTRWKVMGADHEKYMQTGRESDEIRQLQFLSNIDYGTIYEIHGTRRTPVVDLTMSTLTNADPYNAEKFVLTACKMRTNLELYLTRASVLAKSKPTDKDACFPIMLTTSKNLVHHTLDLFEMNRYIKENYDKSYNYVPPYGTSPYLVVDMKPDVSVIKEFGVYAKTDTDKKTPLLTISHLSGEVKDYPERYMPQRDVTRKKAWKDAAEAAEAAQ